MADIGISVERPAYSVAVTATPPPAFEVAVITSPAPASSLAVSVTPPPVLTVEVTRVEGGAPGIPVLVHEQTNPASEWFIAHPWGVKPASVQLEIGGALVLADVSEITAAHVVLLFPVPTTGTLTLIRGA